MSSTTDQEQGPETSVGVPGQVEETEVIHCEPGSAVRAPSLRLQQAWTSSSPVVPPARAVATAPPPLSPAEAQQCEAVMEALGEVACEWDALRAVLEKFTLSDAVLEEVLRRSAEKLGFWSPDLELLSSAGRAVRRCLAKGSTSKDFSSQEVVPTASSKREHSKLGIGSGFDRQISGQSQHSRAATKQSMMTTESGYLAKGPCLGFTTPGLAVAVGDETLNKAKDLAKKELLLNLNPAASRLRQFKWALFFFVTMQMVMFAFYVVFYMTPMTWDVIGLPILIARGSAYGACFWTGILFLTMSRDLISFVTRISCVRNSQLAMQLINCHKEIHIFSAYELVLDGCCHALMHHIGTFVALEREGTGRLNKMFVCAQDKSTLPDGYIGKVMSNFLKALQYPACPLPEDAEVGYFDGVFSTPGITGYLLLAVIFALAWFSRTKKRRANFRLFYALHHFLVPSWVILLVLHGANDWVGLGFPLVILVAAIPVFAYFWTRLRRVYLTLRHDTPVVNAEKSATGKLLRLEVRLRSSYRKCQVGEYAYVNIPKAGRTEWHPYTICDAKALPGGEQVITFCMMSVGHWTRKVHALFDAAAGGEEQRPKVYIDGPFYAPTVSMPSRSTVVGIGAGVGVTPFLSFLGSMAGNERSQHRNSHVFWMSAFATDFMLFKDLFSSLDTRAKQDGTTTTFHLHATPRFGAWNGKGPGSLFELAAREVWADWQKRLHAKEPQKVPTFSKYKQPLHAVVSHNLLESRRPLAVAVGSPDWVTELLAVGEADLAEDVFVYFCGNDFLKGMVQSACIACNDVRVNRGQNQRYYFYFERFG